MPYYYLEFVTCGVEGDLREGQLLESFKEVKDALREFQSCSRYVVTELVITRQVT